MSKEVLARHWEELGKKANFLNVALGTKFKDGHDTGVPAIVVFVSKKVAVAELAAEHLIPPEIEGVPTDVRELAPATWQAGKTAISQLHPEHQIRRLGLKDKPLPKVRSRLLLDPKTPSGASDFIKWLNTVQDQGNCGNCTAYGNIGVWEALIRLAANNPALAIKLSEIHLFFCAGGTCDGGNTVEATLSQAIRGVCTEDCLPCPASVSVNGQDQACGAGICADWQTKLFKLASWDAVNDPVQIKLLLDTKPLNATMSVHQSFFNYQGGVYKNLGPQDPEVGGHDIGCVGYSDALGAYLIRNSWSIGWGSGCVVNGVVCPGYAWVDYSELNPQMQELIPDGSVPVPIPPPGPTPSPCKVGNGIASIESWITKMLRRKGRFFYLNP